MFSGIVEEVGRVKSLSGGKLTIKAKKVLDGINPGDSIAVNGVCLTVVSVNKESFTTELMPQTIKLTNLGGLHPGDLVNLERALSYGGRVGGHLVQGHVDGVGRIISMSWVGRSLNMKISLPPHLSPYVVLRGFIAVDGVSLTVAEIGSSDFSVFLVSYTLNNTNLGRRRVGDLVNLEVDFMAKYIRRWQDVGKHS